MATKKERQDQWTEQDKRIDTVLAGLASTAVCQESLKAWLLHLKAHLVLPCTVTGIEDFPWEERFFFGVGTEEEHQRLRKTMPSCEDEFELIALDDSVEHPYGLIARVKRLSDKKKFAIPLADLECVDPGSSNYQLLHDYEVWHVNY